MMACASEMPFSVAAQEIVNMYSSYLNLSENKNFISLYQRGVFFKACVQVKCMMTWNYNLQDFSKIIHENQDLPLEFFWSLHIFQIMPLDVYLLTKHLQDKSLKYKESLCAICLQDSKEDNYILFLQSGMMCYFINKAFPVLRKDGQADDIEMISLSIISHILQGIFSMKKEDIAVEKFTALFSLHTCGTLEKTSLVSFWMHMLELFLQFGCATEVDAWISRENWENKSDPFHLLAVIEEITKDVQSSTLEKIVHQALQKNHVNWKNFLVVIALFIKKAEGPAIISKLVTELTIEAFECMSSSTLLKSMLISQQVALNSDSAFPVAFSHWYQVHLKENVLLKNHKNFTFCIKTLSDLVPFEKNLSILKLYLERPLYPPQECISIYADYVAVLKTRIKDLEPQVNYEEILQKVLNSFEETGKIPPFIIEASLMQKHVYLNQFLPALLKPRIVPKIHDSREKFIEELNRAGKIPRSHLEKYKYDCQLR